MGQESSSYQQGKLKFINSLHECFEPDMRTEEQVSEKLRELKSPVIMRNDSHLMKEVLEEINQEHPPSEVLLKSKKDFYLHSYNFDTIQ